MGRRITPETSLKKTCLEYLRLKYGTSLWYVNVPGGVMTRPGTPDTLICLNGQFISIEFKNGDKGKLTPAQEDTLWKIIDSGGIALVVRSFDDCEEKFKKIDRKEYAP
jgi:hypothetical protein